MKKKYVTLTTPPQTRTFTMPADFVENRRLIYYCKKTNKQYDIENLIAENLELKRKISSNITSSKKSKSQTKLRIKYYFLEEVDDTH